MDYSIKYSARKTLCLKITDTGDIIVLAPYGASRNIIDRFVTSHQKWIISKKAVLTRKRELMNTLTTSDIEKLKKDAYAYIPDRVREFEKVMGVSANGIRITSAKTRFGSCNASDSLYFSLYLMTYPKEAIDYVIVHELAHIKQKNHSPAFYDIVKSVLPDYKSTRQLLKNGIL